MSYVLLPITLKNRAVTTLRGDGMTDRRRRRHPCRCFLCAQASYNIAPDERDGVVPAYDGGLGGLAPGVRSAVHPCIATRTHTTDSHGPDTYDDTYDGSQR